ADSGRGQHRRNRFRRTRFDYSVAHAVGSCMHDLRRLWTPFSVGSRGAAVARVPAASTQPRSQETYVLAGSERPLVITMGVVGATEEVAATPDAGRAQDQRRCTAQHRGDRLAAGHQPAHAAAPARQGEDHVSGSARRRSPRGVTPLLEHTDLEPIDISFLLGFAEPNSFARAFRTWERTTPLRWRVAHS